MTNVQDAAPPAAPVAVPPTPPAASSPAPAPAAPNAPPASAAAPTTSAASAAAKTMPTASRPSLLSRLLGWIPSHAHAVILVIAGMLFLVAIMLVTH